VFPHEVWMIHLESSRELFWKPLQWVKSTPKSSSFSPTIINSLHEAPSTYMKLSSVQQDNENKQYLPLHPTIATRKQ
jgi:hypothetical protein